MAYYWGGAELWIKNAEHPASVCCVLVESFMGRANNVKEVVILFVSEDDEGMILGSYWFLLFQGKLRLTFPKYFLQKKLPVWETNHTKVRCMQ